MTGCRPSRFGHSRPNKYKAYAFPLDIIKKDLSCLKATPKADISSPEIYNRNEGKALAIPLAEFGNNNCVLEALRRNMTL